MCYVTTPQWQHVGVRRHVALATVAQMSGAVDISHITILMLPLAIDTLPRRRRNTAAAVGVQRSRPYAATEGQAVGRLRQNGATRHSCQRFAAMFMP